MIVTSQNSVAAPSRQEPGFDEVARAIVATPPRERPAVKEAAIAIVDRDERVPHSAGKVFRVMLASLRWDSGLMVATNEACAAAARVSLRSVERASQILQERGYVIRERLPRTGRRGRGSGYDRWQGTLPAILQAVAGLRNHPTAVSATTRQDCRVSDC